MPFYLSCKRKQQNVCFQNYVEQKQEKKRSFVLSKQQITEIKRKNHKSFKKIASTIHKMTPNQNGESLNLNISEKHQKTTEIVECLLKIGLQKNYQVQEKLIDFVEKKNRSIPLNFSLNNVKNNLTMKQSPQTFSHLQYLQRKNSHPYCSKKLFKNSPPRSPTPSKVSLTTQKDYFSIGATNNIQEKPFKVHKKKSQIKTIYQNYSSSSEDQYQPNATPGPGQYEQKKIIKLNKQKNIIKGSLFSCSKSFVSTKRMPTVGDYNLVAPNFKRFSRASQKKVGFGAVNSFVNRTIVNQNYKFYDSYLPTDSKRFSKKHIPFYSKSQRFAEPKIQERKSNIITEQTESIKIQKRIFSCQKKRPLIKKCITQDVQYTGQDFYSIQKEQSCRMQRFQAYEIKNPAFSTVQERFPFYLKEKASHQQKKNKQQIKSIQKTYNQSAFKIENKNKLNQICKQNLKQLI